jgi:ribonucleotide reductase beta subunit family protein with ferritin-like domain
MSLLTPNDSRFVVLPIHYKDIWDCYEKHNKAIWHANEIDLTNDKQYWKSLNDNERHFIKYVLAFFAGSDGIVMENLCVKFYNEVQIPEARAFYSVQIFMENVHSITYSRLIDTLIENNDEKNMLFNAIQNISSIKKKADWALKWIQSADSFAMRLMGFAAVEGIFFSGSFCCIYWLNERGVMPGLCKSNEFIARDEGLHTDFACLLYKNHIPQETRLSNAAMYEIINDAVDIEIEFITESLPCKLLGMNADLMKEYIKYVANRLVIQMGYGEIYKNCKQPFGFMDRICMENKTNFFEARVTEYQINSDVKNDNLNMECDF